MFPKLIISIILKKKIIGNGNYNLFKLVRNKNQYKAILKYYTEFKHLFVNEYKNIFVFVSVIFKSVVVMKQLCIFETNLKT